MGHQFKSLGPCGGAGSSATPGGYNPGPTIAAKGNYSGAVDGIQHKDLRGGTQRAGDGHTQGTTVAAKVKSGDGGGVSHKDLRGGNTPSGSGYKQGPTVTANKK